MSFGHIDEKQRLLAERLMLAVALPGVAGAVNASGFLVVGSYTSHVTGQVARFGDALAQDQPSQAQAAVLLVALFFLGAFTATALIERAKRVLRARYTVPLLVEAAALLAYAWGARDHLSESRALQLSALLCFSMGLQNALVTRISGAVVRTTHLTGIVTDLGIESVRAVVWMRDRLSERSVFRSGELVSLFLADPEWKRLRLHTSIFASFASGAVIGPQLFIHFGQIAMLLPCGVLTLLAAFDFLTGLRTSDDSDHEDHRGLAAIAKK